MLSKIHIFNVIEECGSDDAKQRSEIKEFSMLLKNAVVGMLSKIAKYRDSQG